MRQVSITRSTTGLVGPSKDSAPGQLRGTGLVTNVPMIDV